MINEYTLNKGTGSNLKIKSLFLRYALSIAAFVFIPLILAKLYQYLYIFVMWVYSYIWYLTPYLPLIMMLIAGALTSTAWGALGFGCVCFVIIPLVATLIFYVGYGCIYLYYPFMVIMMLLTLRYHCQTKGNRNAND